MGWNLDRSRERVARRWLDTEGLEVTPLTREMDLTNITLMKPKLVHAAHLYVDVVSFNTLLRADLDQTTAKEILRRLHLQAREITRICEKDFDAAKVHFQGPKLHAIVYRPYGDDSEVARRALLLAAAIKHAVEVVMNDVVDGDWSVAAGVDVGDAVATMNGTRGDRELLFLGNPANRAAKIIDSGITVTDTAADLVADGLEAYISDGIAGTKRFAINLSDLLTAVADSASTWTPAKTEQRFRDELEKWPLDRVQISSADDEIDKSCLGLANNKLVTGANIFCDVDGFTRYVEEAAAIDSDLIHAIRSFHVIRSEMRAVAVADYGALRVQYQGDRMQSLAFMPMDEARIARKAIDIAAGINASIAYALPAVVGDAALPVAIGICLGDTIVTRIGEHGQRDQVCLGAATRDAARFQERLAGAEVGIDKDTLGHLPEELAAEFGWRSTACCYVAEDLTADRVERLLEASEIDARARKVVVGAPALIRSGYETSGRSYHP